MDIGHGDRLTKGEENMVQTAAHARTPRRRKTTLPLILLLVVFLAAGGILVYLAVSAAGKPISAPLPDAPFEVGTAPDPGMVWAAAPTDLPPNTLAIPDLDVRADIVTSGLGANRGMILPHPDKVSHFLNDVHFGEPDGTNLVAGHVDDGDRTHGALWPLHQIKPGTPIYATDDAGTMYTYTAASLKLYEKVALPAEFFEDTGAPRLVLVTCGGPTVPDPSMPSGFTYEHNLVVTASPA
ncbi:class F sortase [Rhodococcus sp. ACPA4]|uniref:class F sortase n=1 Tax=Rhodococcus sp. ACPA4 TaxID=2028571 RepID=UPI00211BE318|nr:class F sortase [Rhodococcus sp. ACPA4]